MLKRILSFVLIAVLSVGTISTTIFAADETTVHNPSVYLSATEKVQFAEEMDRLYAMQTLSKNTITPTRETVDRLLLQIPNATPEERVAINEELASYGVYEFNAPIIERPNTRATDSGDVVLDAPTIYYEAWSNNWSVTCGGHWKNKEYGDTVGNVGGADGFGVGYTNCSNSYSSKVVSASAYMTDNSNSNSESTSNRSDGDGSKGFGFRIQDHWVLGTTNYIGDKWSGVCTYDSWFGNYNGVATAYYIHTYDSAAISGVNFGVEGKTAGVSAGVSVTITNEEKSFIAFSSDKSFGVYP